MNFGVTFSTVADIDEYQFQLDLFPIETKRIVTSVSVVIHIPSNSTGVQGQETQLYVKCENQTALQPIQFYIAKELGEWLELNINTTSMPCSTSKECIFFVKVLGDPSELDTILVVYDYTKLGGFESDIHTTLQKRSTGAIANKTLLRDLQAGGVNCSVQHVFLNYRTELHIFDATQTVISPNNIGINMSYCYGACDSNYTLPANITSVERFHCFRNILQDIRTPIPGVCCVPDEIENDELIISSMNGELIELKTFPQVLSCKCII